MLKKVSSYTFILLGMIVLFNSCKKEYESIESIDQAKIKEYLSKNNITNAVADPSGYYYQVVTPGTGDLFLNTDSVLYNIEVKSLLNGTVYYSSPTVNNMGTYVGYTNSFMGDTVSAIRTAIRAIKPGGVVRVILPSYLAFGKNGLTTINVPSNEVIDLVITTYPEKKQAELDDRRIREFLTAKGLTATKDPESGVYYVVTQAGTGTEVIDLFSTLKLNYTGRTLDGKQFDSSTDGTFTTALNDSGLVVNWDVLTNFKKGAKVRVFVPSRQAYGTRGTEDGVMAPNLILDFDIEIVEVTN